MGVTEQKGCVGVVSAACTLKCVLLVCLVFLAQEGDILREEMQEKTRHSKLHVVYIFQRYHFNELDKKLSFPWFGFGEVSCFSLC